MEAGYFWNTLWLKNLLEMVLFWNFAFFLQKIVRRLKSLFYHNNADISKNSIASYTSTALFNTLYQKLLLCQPLSSSDDL